MKGLIRVIRVLDYNTLASIFYNHRSNVNSKSGALSFEPLFDQRIGLFNELGRDCKEAEEGHQPAQVITKTDQSTSKIFFRHNRHKRVVR